ncbi:hypothetical protein OXX80_001348 [Metschnikowia pulcherrima]
MSETKANTTQFQHEQIAQNLAEIKACLEENTGLSVLPKKILSLKSKLNAFEQVSRALDGHLKIYVPTIISLYFLSKENLGKSTDSASVSELLADLIYVLAKVRGYKSVANELSSDVYLVPRLVSLVESPEVKECPSECYVLLLWLSRLVLVPFPLSTVQIGLDTHLFQIALKNLALHSTASKTQVISSTLLASLVMRPDCIHLLTQFFEDTTMNWPVMEENAKLGQLMTINQILKKTSSGLVADFIQEAHGSIILYEFAQVKYGRIGKKLNTFNALYLLKVSAKVSQFFISKGNYELVAGLINQTNDLMHHMGDRFDNSLRECMAKNLANTVSFLATKAVNYADQVIEYMLEQLHFGEDDQISQISGYTGDLHICSAHLSVPRYHTVLLFMGFLALKKALPEKFIPILFSITHQTCFVSQRNYSFVQTSQIRDASCFCLWAACRFLSKHQFAQLKKEYSKLVPTFLFDLVSISIFDEDFTMRRCGIAVIQELVGRFGADFLGDILGTVDTAMIGEFSIKFVELFGSSTVGSLADSHDVMHSLIKMKCSPALFVHRLLDEIMADSSSFELQKLGSHHLALILSSDFEPLLALPISEPFEKFTIIATLLKEFKRGNHGALYALAEMNSGRLLEEEIIEKVFECIESTNLDVHFPIAGMGESIMHWLNSFAAADTTRHGVSPGITSLIQKMDATPGLVSEFQNYFENLHNIKDSEFSALCRQIRSGNKLLAASIMSAKMDAHQLRQLCSVLVDKSVDAEIRATLISKMNIGKNIHNKNLLFPTLIGLLDDYTTSEQGDVGSKVRSACIEIFHQNIRMLKKENQDLTELQMKLLRIAGETIDKLRVNAFSLLCEINQESKSTDEPHYASDYDVYFGDLFRFYKHHYLTLPDFSEAFWSGIVHSAGAATGANTMINSSFRHVLEHLRNTNVSENTFVALLTLLKVPAGVPVSSLDRRVLKTIHATMNLIVKLFEAGIDFANPVHYDALYVRAHNLHINTSNVSRIALAVRVFQHISTCENVSVKTRNGCRKRLCWLCCNHVNGHVRVSAADALFEVINETDPENSVIKMLESTPWESEKAGPTLSKTLEKAFLTTHAPETR